MCDMKNKFILKGRLDSQQKSRLAKLMNMLYSPSELAEEIGFDRRQIYRVYLPLGCPHTRNKNNRVWINGIDFKNWILAIYKKKELAKDEAFCLSCKKQVKIKNPIQENKNGLIFYVCECPHCGRRIAKIITREKK